MPQNKSARMALTFREKMPDPPEGKFGTYLGDGDGIIAGDFISGDVHWRLFEIQGENACDANFIGRIETAKSDRVDFEILGFFVREQGTPHWHLTAAIRFASAQERHAALDGAAGIVRGIFDMSDYTHNYSVALSP